MESFLEKLEQLETLIKGFKPMMMKPRNDTTPTLPQMPALKAPTTAAPMPKAPSLPKIAPQSNKDPKKMAEQLKSGQQKKMSMMSTKVEVLKTDKNGQWSIE